MSAPSTPTLFSQVTVGQTFSHVVYGECSRVIDVNGNAKQYDGTVVWIPGLDAVLVESAPLDVMPPAAPETH